jgi:hypothetical protein
MVGGRGRISVGAEIEYLRGHALLHESHYRQNVRLRLTGGVGRRVEQDEALLLPRIASGYRSRAPVVDYRSL